MSNVLNDIRKAIKASSLTRYRMSKATDIDHAQMCRLMAGKSGLSIASLERLADCLGLEIVIRPKRRKKEQRKHGKHRI